MGGICSSVWANAADTDINNTIATVFDFINAFPSRIGSFLPDFPAVWNFYSTSSKGIGTLRECISYF
jgi:hypothetical protein